ncbi:MAG: hypothetical protein H0U23_04820 [Blastocatellia bacterium]|nr:hypothetical protein [Blastocatellia bacterium]
MYHVSIFYVGFNSTHCIDQRDFAFGTFAEIGFFLDHYGYNDRDYRVEITFSN